MSFLAVAALALTGCWAKVIGTGQYRDITLTSDFSRRLISSCGDQFGNGSERNFCILDQIRRICQVFPEKGVTQDDCIALGSPDRWEELDPVIDQVIGTSNCLVFLTAPHPSDDTWTWARHGADGCA